MKNKTLTEYVPYKVKDLSLAEWGKKEIKLAETISKPKPKKVIKKPKLTDDSFSPSLNEIQIALVSLKKHNC